MIRVNEWIQNDMTFYFVVNNTVENRNEVRWMKFWHSEGPASDIIYALGEVGSNSQIAALEFKDRAYSSPEDLHDISATVSEDKTE